VLPKLTPNLCCCVWVFAVIFSSRTRHGHEVTQQQVRWKGHSCTHEAILC
jgi:hypothetical protein